MIAVFLLLFVSSNLTALANDLLPPNLAKSAYTEIRNFQGMLKDYKRYCGQYPTTEQGLQALAEKPEHGPPCPDYPDSAFIIGRKIPLDPWGHRYRYLSDGKTFRVICYGRDGKKGGKGEDTDISGAGE